VSGIASGRSVAAVTISAILVTASAAFGEAKKAESAQIERKVPETREKRDGFSGTEFRLGAMNYVKADCSSGPVPDVRIVAKPANGELRTEQIVYIVDRTPDNRRAHCNGKEVDAVGLFYKSRDGFVGRDKVLVDVDYKNGTVRRFLYDIAVR